MYSTPSTLVGGEYRDRQGGPSGAPRVPRPDDAEKKDVYSRVTNFVGAAEDKRNLEKWGQRTILVGLAREPELAREISNWKDYGPGHETPESKKALNSVAWRASRAANDKLRASLGTFMHAVTAYLDTGMPMETAINTVNAELDRNLELNTLQVQAIRAELAASSFRADLAAYMRETAHLEAVAIETFVVDDVYRTAGTFDRMVRLDGCLYIADVKTGGSMDFGAGKHAEQLATYARSQWLDRETGQRVPFAAKFGQDVDQERGLIIHLPFNEGRCDLHWIDLTAGWSAVGLSQQVKEYRGKKDWLLGSANLPTAEQAIENLEAGGVAVEEIADPIIAAIDAAGSYEELVALFKQHEGAWNQALTDLAAARKAELAQTA